MFGRTNGLEVEVKILFAIKIQKKFLLPKTCMYMGILTVSPAYSSSANSGCLHKASKNVMRFVCG